jgi:hypothetical protein
MKSLGALAAVFAVALALGGVGAAPARDLVSPQASTQSSAPALFRMDGQLKTPAGDPRTGNVLMVASIYAGSSDAQPLWSEQQLITLDEAGRYTIFVGATLPDGVPKELFLTDAASAGHWIGLAVEGEAELPRVMLLSVPYALRAREADTLAGRSAADFVLSEELTESVKSAVKLAAEGMPGDQSTFLGSAGATGTGTTGSIGIAADGDVQLPINGPPGSLRDLTFQTNGSARWLFRVGNIAETGTNDGSDFSLDARADDASPVTQALFIRRKTGNVGIGTNNPTARLHVVGSTLFAGDTLFTGVDRVAAFRGPGGGANSLIRFADGLTSAFSIGFNSPVSRSFIIFDDVNAAFRMHISNGGGVSFGTFAGSVDAPTNGMVVSGNVGIGTASPSTKLHVAGNALVTGDVTVDGNIAAKYQDVAEWVETPSPLEAGTVVIVDPEEPNRVIPSAKAYDTRVAGAVSAQPGLILGERSDTKAMVAQSGRVRIKADATHGAIRIGDLLVTSGTPGYAMLSKPLKIGGQSLHRPGTLLGKALEALPKGKGEILVLLTLQ